MKTTKTLEISLKNKKYKIFLGNELINKIDIILNCYLKGRKVVILYDKILKKQLNILMSKLNTETNSPDKASPQRPDASITYTEGNVIWYCWYCNWHQKDYSDKVWQKKEIGMVNKLISLGEAKIEDGKVILS